MLNDGGRWKICDPFKAHLNEVYYESENKICDPFKAPLDGTLFAHAMHTFTDASILLVYIMHKHAHTLSRLDCDKTFKAKSWILKFGSHSYSS